jgi:hypothetical protein
LPKFQSNVGAKFEALFVQGRNTGAIALLERQTPAAFFQGLEPDELRPDLKRSHRKQHDATVQASFDTWDLLVEHTGEGYTPLFCGIQSCKYTITAKGHRRFKERK